MSRLWLTADLHLGHRNISTFRPEFNSSEEHHEIIFDNLASSVNKRDTLYILGDAAFDKYWLDRLASIKCAHKKIIVGNHDLEFGLKMKDLVEAFDDVQAMYSKRNYWYTHCPIHPQEMRKRKANIHGHIHGNMIWKDWEEQVEYPVGYSSIDPRYINVCVEHTDWKPVLFKDATL